MRSAQSYFPMQRNSPRHTSPRVTQMILSPLMRWEMLQVAQAETDSEPEEAVRTRIRPSQRWVKF